MEQRAPFRFLTNDEFEKLSQEQKVSYLAEAVNKLHRMHATSAAGASKQQPEEKPGRRNRK